MIRILHVVDSMNRAGQETFIMNVYRNIDRSQFQFDFIQFQKDPADYDAEILELGGRIYHATPKGQGLRQSMQEIKHIVAEGGYKVVHRHFSNASMVFELFAAKRGGASCLIAHSHSSSSNNKSTHRLLRRPLYRVADWHLACAEDAGLWMFGDRAFQIIPNGIDTDMFKYNENDCIKVRDELDISPEQMVFGHVGRFSEVKNHSFILETFKEIVAEVPDAQLILVGDGPLRPAMEQWCELHQLKSHVHFLGVRSDIARIVSAMNCFLMPSLYEGLPVTLVEAQSSGLPCLIADTITADIKLTDCVEFLNLDESPRVWAIKAIEMAMWPRIDTTEAIRKSGYDIRDVARALQTVYAGAHAPVGTKKVKAKKAETK